MTSEAQFRGLHLSDCFRNGRRGLIKSSVFREEDDFVLGILSELLEI